MRLEDHIVNLEVSEIVPLSIRESISVFSDKGLTDGALGYHKMNPKSVEIDDFLAFSNQLVEDFNADEDSDGWFLGTDLGVIPDFDALWFGDGVVINLDLKHEKIGEMEEKLRNKFEKQAGVFNLFENLEILQLVYIASERKLLQYSKLGFTSFSFKTLSEKLRKFAAVDNPKNIIAAIEPSDYLVSPISNVEKFLQGRYWLTPDQESIAEKCSQNGLYAVRGPAGSGKSLIAYDLARRLSETKKILFVFSGSLRPAHTRLEQELPNASFISAKSFKEMDIDGFDCILVDEAQRLYAKERIKLVTWAEAHLKDHTIVVFYDVNQALGRKDAGNLMNSVVNSWIHRKLAVQFVLNKGLRSNPSIHAFVRELFALEKKPPLDVGIDDMLKSVEVRYFSTHQAAFYWIENRINQGYQFIVPTPSTYNKSSSDAFSEMSADFLNTHNVIGGEFEDVVTYLDERISYGNDGHLKGDFGEYYTIKNETYVNMTRAKSHLAIAIINNPDVYQAITHVVFARESKEDKVRRE